MSNSTNEKLSKKSRYVCGHGIGITVGSEVDI